MAKKHPAVSIWIYRKRYLMHVFAQSRRALSIYLFIANRALASEKSFDDATKSGGAYFTSVRDAGRYTHRHTHIQYLNINYNLETSTHIRSPAYTTFTEYAMQLWACSPISIRIKCVVILRAQPCSVQSTLYEFRFTPNGHKTQIHRRPHTEHCNFSDTWSELVETYRAKNPVAIWGFQ